MLDLWFIVKLLFLFALLLYVVFATVVVRQVYLMTKTLHTSFDFVVRSFAWLHLFVALAVIIFALFIL